MAFSFFPFHFPSQIGKASRLFQISAALLSAFIVGSPATTAAESDAKRAEIVLQALEIAEPLEVDLFASDPLLYNPVAFSIDEQGRFFISETHRYKDSIFDIWAADQRWKDADASFRTVEDREKFLVTEFADNPEFLTKDSEILRLVEDRDGDGKADFSAVFADGFNLPTSGTAAGALAHNGVVWFTNIPDLWRFEYDVSGNRTKSERLHTGYGVRIGVSGHDLHGLIMGPDGKLYFTIGDRGAHITTPEGNLIDLPNTGIVFRCDPDGANLEVFATGLRNPQALAFDRYGNLWTHDNDTAGQDKSRVIHIVEGGDYGWRYSYQFMRGFGPWVQEKVWAGAIDDVLPNAGYGAQGPSGLAYYPGLGLPEKYNNHFFAADFPKGVLTYSFQPAGASYEIDKPEHFVWNAGITDVAFGPDGDVYFTDWGRSYQMPGGGFIYRVFDPAQTENPALDELKKTLGDGMNHRPLSELQSLLAHADMRVRQAAQFELTERASESTEKAAEISELLQTVARKNENLFARLHAIWALEKLQPDDARETFATLLDDSDPEIRAHAAKTIGSAGWTSFAPAIAEKLQDPNLRVRAFAAASLGKLAASNNESDRTIFFEPLLAFLRENDDEDAYLTHAGLMALLDLNNFSLIEEAARNESPAIRRAAMLAMRRLKRVEIVQFLDDPNDRVRYEAIRAINDAPINEAMPQLAKLLESPDLPGKFLSRLINANFRVGKPENADRLAAFAARSDLPDSARIEALKALGDWENPAPRDRVVGIWRPLESRDAEPARSAFIATGKILIHSSESVQTAVIETAAKLDASEIGDALFELLKTPGVSVALRRSIPATLVEFDFPRLPEMMAIILADEDLSVRTAGVELLDQVKIPQTSELLATLVETEDDLRLSQTALMTLGRLTQPDAQKAIADLLDQMLAGTLRPELHLDLLEAAGKNSSPAIEQRLERYAQTFSPDDTLAPYRATLVGGNAELGNKLFHNRDDLGCLRCHAINGKGGNLGPDLGNIGNLRDRSYLLESIIEPNKHFAPGYELIVVETTDGETVAGTVVSETDEQIVLTRQDKTVTIAKNQISKRHPSISTMPSGLEKLMTDRELRDLIEYLAQLKN
ncbi:MAG TPA: HEAT repeat domain-containing protein [Opitutales bacterium]|nr:HEAT repeat domain-containing protein [Opitutales bacterium]